MTPVMRIGAAGHYGGVSDHCRAAMDVRVPRASTESLARPTFGERLEALNRADQFARSLDARVPAIPLPGMQLAGASEALPPSSRPQNAPRLGEASPVTPDRTERVVRAAYEIPVLLSRGFTLDVLA